MSRGSFARFLFITCGAALIALPVTAGDLPARLRPVMLRSDQAVAVSVSAAEQTETLATFRVQRHGDVLLVPVELDGQTWQFVLDTGSACSVFDSSLRQHLGPPLPPMKANTPAGSAMIDTFAAPRATFGGIPFGTSGPVACLDLSLFRHISGYPIYGLLGMDVLRHHIVRIDCDRGEVSFLKSLPARRGQLVGLAESNGTFNTVAGIADQSHSVLIDTGAIGTSLSVEPWLYQELETAGTIATASLGLSSTIAGTRTKSMARCPRVHLSRFSHENVWISTSELPAVGMDYLSRFVVTFDFPNSVAYFEKGQAYNAPDRLDQSGLHFQREGRQTVIIAVESDSSVASTVAPGDHLISINGQDCASLTAFEIRKRFANATEPLTLVTRRGAETRAARLLPKTD